MDGNHNFNAFYNWMKNAEPSNDQNTQTSQNSSNPAPFPDMGNISMHPLPIHFAPRVANMGNPFAMSSQNWGNFQHVINPTMIGGASTESSADQRPQTPTGAVEESQVPNISSDVDADARIGEECGRVNGRSNQKVRFTLAENTLLIQSWLNISKDPIKGNDQKSDTFWSISLFFCVSSAFPISN
ncbi:uncharacterized protein LOC130736347 [Lotus japonicus]|uniref:uncharacterized protein LOC130736347 n=1 Tax=Lotus japonicus TaxID=34305 RepID=UPI002584F428|nr:uncharacterized protein LOC130736347 [Lotus japonicus]